MHSNGETSSPEDSNGESSGGLLRKRLRDRSEKVAKTKELLSKQADQTKLILSKHADKIAKRAEEHERFINKGPLSWALIVWRCSLVFNSFDKIVSVFIHLLPGLVFFTIRWWDPVFFEAMHPEGTPRRPSWPYVESKYNLWTWLFIVPLVAYCLWQALYFLIVDVLRRQRLLRDPEVMTSYRELSKKAQKANNLWWRLSGILGDQNRLLMYIVLQGIFTVATMALTVPIFLSYKLSVIFQILKLSATVWNGGNFLLEVMPRQYVLKEKKKSEGKLEQTLKDQSTAPENSMSSYDRCVPQTMQAEQDQPVVLESSMGTNNSAQMQESS